MKFWLTVVLGVMVVAGGSTALMVMSPTVQPTPAAKKAAVAIDPETQAVAEVVGPEEFNHDGLGQGQAGQDVFKIKNSGKGPLVLTPMTPTCQCTSLYIVGKEPRPDEPAPKIAQEKSNHTVQPGEIGYVVARWNTKDKLAKQNVGVPVSIANDPRRQQITFRINLDIHKEFSQSSDTLELGMLNEGQTRTTSATITSLIRDKFEVDQIDVGSKWFQTKAVPLTKEELMAAGAKSGYRLEVTSTKDAPVGPIEEYVAASLKTPNSRETIKFNLRGLIVGDFETVPPGAVIDFKEVTRENCRPKKVWVFARNLSPSDSLRIGTVKPAETLSATIEKDPKSTRWTLSVSIKPKAPGGYINGGSVAIVDSTGRERLVFKVNGIVDPAFTQTAAR